jgi:DNA-binding NarL/FixJ family response regulator
MAKAANKPKSSYRPARILIVDDHPLVRSGLGELISNEPGLEVCGEADDADDALRKVAATSPDLIVIDISLKSSSGIDLIKRIKDRHPQVKMLVSSMHDESLFAERSLSAGAMGYISKQEAIDKVIVAILHVLRGQIYLSTQMSERLLHRMISGPKSLERSPIESLSDRELQVFEQIGKGLTTREIAGNLHLSIKTIETYRDNIKTKLNLTNTAELSRHAVQWVLENG